MEIRPVKRSGMLTFAGVMLILAGSFNLLDGVLALTKDELFRADQLLFGDLSAWGFWWLFIGLLLVWAGVQVLQPQGGRPRPRHRARGAEHLHSALCSSQAHTGRAVTIMVIDVIVIWAVCAHADEFE